MKKLSREDVLDHLQELKEYFQSEVKKRESKLIENELIVQDLKLIKGSDQFLNFVNQLKNSLENKGVIDLNLSINSFKNKIIMIDALIPIIKSLDSAVKIYNYNYIIESTGAQVSKELKNFTKEEFIANLKELENNRREILNNVTRIISDNDIALAELKSKSWSKEARPIFKRMIDRLKVMNKQQKPEITNNKAVLNGIVALRRMLEKEAFAVELLNALLQINSQ